MYFFEPLNGRFKHQAIESMDLIIAQHTESDPSLIIKDHKNHVNNVMKSLEHLKGKTKDMYKYMCTIVPVNKQRIKNKYKNVISCY